MDPEDLLEFGVLFGGFEIIEGLLAIGAVLVVLAVLVGAVMFLDFGVTTILVTGALMAGSAIAGGIAGMKAERLRGKHF
ncbi:hypothetical protein [Halovenus marina]|uniref:hypothetical protein n=1 Tax=Halovenus marina TaxID=3396621 RepID=UPI003F544359